MTPVYYICRFIWCELRTDNFHFSSIWNPTCSPYAYLWLMNRSLSCTLAPWICHHVVRQAKKKIEGGKCANSERLTQRLNVPWCRTEEEIEGKKSSRVHGTSVWWIPSAGHVCSPSAASSVARRACVVYACAQVCDMWKWLMSCVFVSFISHSLKCKVSGVRPKEISNVKKSAESIFVLFLCTCLLTYLRFVFSQPARGSQFALGLTFFPWSTSMAPTAHTFSHSQQKHIFFVLPKCLQNLYQTESSPPCAINPE